MFKELLRYLSEVLDKLLKLLSELLSKLLKILKRKFFRPVKARIEKLNSFKKSNYKRKSFADNKFSGISKK